MGKSLEKSLCAQETLLELRYFERGLSKTSDAWKQLSFLLQVARFVQKCSLTIHHPCILDAFEQGGFGATPKITIGNIWKPIHDVKIILFSTSFLNLERLERKEKNSKKRLSREPEQRFSQNYKHFS